MSTQYSDLHIRMDAEIKTKAEAILDDLGIAPSSAVNIFYRQVIAHDGLPFEVVRAKNSLPNLDEMTKGEVVELLDKSMEDMNLGNGLTVEEAFKKVYGGEDEEV